VSFNPCSGFAEVDLGATRSNVLCLSEFSVYPSREIPLLPLPGSDGQGVNSRTMWAYIDPSFVEDQWGICQGALAH
jgi:hypothetical protein